MNQQEFVNLIKTVVTESAIEGTLAHFKELPGRSLDPKLMELSKWYNKLDDNQKLNVKEIIDFAVNGSVFGFLCVLDGVRTVENTSEKGVFKLSFIKNSSEVVLNDTDSDFLHDIYNSY